MSQQKWDGWDAETQALVQQAATEAMDDQKQVTREATEGGLALLAREGMEVHQPTEAELQAFRDATQSAFYTWAAKVGPELVELFQTTIEAGGQG